jgi:hypothetical protein
MTHQELVNTEVFTQNSPLSGSVPAGKTVGINTSTGDFYYVNALNQWTLVPAGTVVNLIQQTN